MIQHKYLLEPSINSIEKHKSIIWAVKQQQNSAQKILFLTASQSYTYKRKNIVAQTTTSML